MPPDPQSRTQVTLVAVQSLDGCITRGAEPGVGFASEADQVWFRKALNQFDAIVMGRKTYEPVRRHLRHLGAPILGDTTYGDNTANKAARERFGLMRLALHAWKLQLPHPISGETVSVVADPPADLTDTMAAMGFWPLA